MNTKQVGKQSLKYRAEQVINRLRDAKTIRFLAKPYVDWRKKREHERYLLSPDHFYLQTLKGVHEGARCFIIGNGPSLCAEDLEKLCGESTFASNRIFKIFDQTDWRPTYYLSVDNRVLDEVQNELTNYELGHMFLKYGKCTIKGATNRLTRIYDKPLAMDVNLDRFNNTNGYVSQDVSDHFCDSGTVTFHAIQLAIYMGFKEIYLLGVDHNYSRIVDVNGKIHVDMTIEDYFDHKKYINNYPALMDNMQYAYEIAKEYCDNHGIKIYNATRGRKLEVFKRVDFDKLMRQEHKEGTA